jgi:hypothetical protein
MGLSETQTALARLLTEGELRARFFAEPEVVGPELGLDVRETGQLLQITAGKAAEMARCLQNKRLNEVRKCLPRSAEALGPRFAPLFYRFAAGSTPRGVKKHVADALAFADFLCRSEVRKTLNDRQCDLLRYEAARLQLEGKPPILRPLSKLIDKYLSKCDFFSFPLRERGRGVRSGLDHF